MVTLKKVQSICARIATRNGLLNGTFGDETSAELRRLMIKLGKEIGDTGYMAPDMIHLFRQVKTEAARIRKETRETEKKATKIRKKKAAQAKRDRRSTQ